MSSPEVTRADRRVRRWAMRALGFGVIMVAGCAWMTRNDTPFLPAFLLQTLAAFYFVALIFAAIWLGMLIGGLVGKLNGVLGFIVGFAVAIAAFFFGGLLSTELPILGPPLERFVSLID